MPDVLVLHVVMLRLQAIQLLQLNMLTDDAITRVRPERMAHPNLQVDYEKENNCLLLKNNPKKKREIKFFHKLSRVFKKVWIFVFLMIYIDLDFVCF